MRWNMWKTLKWPKNQSIDRVFFTWLKSQHFALNVENFPATGPGWTEKSNLIEIWSIVNRFWLKWTKYMNPLNSSRLYRLVPIKSNRPLGSSVWCKFSTCAAVHAMPAKHTHTLVSNELLCWNWRTVQLSVFATNWNNQIWSDHACALLLLGIQSSLCASFFSFHRLDYSAKNKLSNVVCDHRCCQHSFFTLNPLVAFAQPGGGLNKSIRRGSMRCACM